MKIITSYSKPITDKYHRGYDRDAGQVSEIVIHGTGGGGSAKGLLSWMLNDGRLEYYRGIALFHYLIDREGKIYEIVPHDKWVYHSSSGKHDLRTIGIELMNPTKNNGGGYTDSQYESLFWLIRHMREIYNISAIAGHGRNRDVYSGSYKSCPGPRFDWGLLADEFNGILIDEYITIA